VLSLDLASEKLAQGDGASAARILESAAASARQQATGLNPASATAKFLIAFADNAAARSRAFNASAPKQALDAAGDLYTAGSSALQIAQNLERHGMTSDARLLRAIGADSRVQASIVAEGASNTNSLVGLGLSKTYQQIVNASFDARIKDTRSWAWPWEDSSPAAKLSADKQKMGVVFDELNRTMQEQGVSLDRAWSSMFDDNHIDGWNSQPRVLGFPTRHEAAVFLRDHQVTQNLLMPFAEMAGGFSQGDAGAIDKAQGDLVRALRANDQFEISRAVLNRHLEDARTPQGQAEARQLDASESREWWTAKAEQFAERDLPILLLSTAISGGLGAGARGLAMAATWGARAARGVQVAVELGTFVPTERILNEAINNKKADWSAGALARDYAFTIGGYALLRAAGAGWQALRQRGFAGSILGPAKSVGETVEVVTPDGIKLRVGRQQLEAELASPGRQQLEAELASPARQQLKAELAGPGQQPELANPGGAAGKAAARLSTEEQRAIDEIAAFRKTNNMPEFRMQPGESGTVSQVEVNGQKVYGFNTTLERTTFETDNRALREAALSEIQTKLGKLQGVKYGGRDAMFLTHAEAETLIKAHAQFGKLPEELTMYVDRPTCNACRGGNSTDKGLSLLADLYSVKELKIIDSYANKLLVRPGQATVRLP